MDELRTLLEDIRERLVRIENILLGNGQEALIQRLSFAVREDVAGHGRCRSGGSFHRAGSPRTHLHQLADLP